MESKDGLKEVDIKNCTCYYFDDIMRVRDRDIDFSDILLEIDSYNSLPIEKVLTFHNAIMLIKSVIHKNKNNCYYNIFLEKGLHKDKSNTEYF